MLNRTPAARIADPQASVERSRSMVWDNHVQGSGWLGELEWLGAALAGESAIRRAPGALSGVRLSIYPLIQRRYDTKTGQRRHCHYAPLKRIRRKGYRSPRRRRSTGFELKLGLGNDLLKFFRPRNLAPRERDTTQTGKYHE